MNRLKHIQGGNGKVGESRLARAGLACPEAPLTNGQIGEPGASATGVRGSRRIRPKANGQNGEREAARVKASAKRKPLENGGNGAKTAPEQPTGRQANGQFAKGNAGGPGNPFARRTAALRKALCEVVTEEDIKELGRLLLAMAKEGDLAAMKLLFTHVIGRPAAAVDPDTLDQQEWAHFQGEPTTPQELHRIMHSTPAGLACLLLRFIMPNQRRLMSDDVIRMMKGFDRRDERRAQRKAQREAKAASESASAKREPFPSPVAGEGKGSPDAPPHQPSPIMEEGDGFPGPIKGGEKEHALSNGTKRGADSKRRKRPSGRRLELERARNVNG